MGYTGDSAKIVQLQELAEKRCNARLIAGYRQPERWFRDQFKDLVSPNSRTAGNVDADFVVVLQDWASDQALDALSDVEKADVALNGYNGRLKTNRRLISLLKRHLGVDLRETYVTNAFPFVKSGGISARIKRRDVAWAAAQFAIREIEIVKPRYVLALGRVPARALRDGGGCENLHELPHPVAWWKPAWYVDSLWERFARGVKR